MSNFIFVLCFVKLHIYFSHVHDAEPHLCHFLTPFACHNAFADELVIGKVKGLTP